MAKEKTIKKCPSCGCIKEVEVCLVNREYYVTCNKCGMRSPSYTRLRNAIDRWNKMYIAVKKG